MLLHTALPKLLRSPVVLGLVLGYATIINAQLPTLDTTSSSPRFGLPGISTINDPAIIASFSLPSGSIGTPIIRVFWEVDENSLSRASSAGASTISNAQSVSRSESSGSSTSLYGSSAARATGSSSGIASSNSQTLFKDRIPGFYQLFEYISRRIDFATWVFECAIVFAHKAKYS
ncbi:uncharacterized protein L3040_004484 [Drepanopeziza brunnea f. sp. 'multigermtubi']|uniref:uncharacterized protein n=1 Tax=Drepanopeziza brunnea f. sp. 'multigermtubi' TaxID=698441 RepID=UPI002393F793|nr:hypothetical protein L3040_004484 [Drepanopeziza brunnea f. sp. 'multigermtubi']